VRLERGRARVGPRAWATVGAAAVLAIGAIAFWSFRSSTRAQSSDWVQVTNFPDAATQPALSPDGRMVTFIRGAVTFTTEGQICVKLLPDGDAVPLTNDTLDEDEPGVLTGRIADRVCGGGQPRDRMEHVGRPDAARRTASLAAQRRRVDDLEKLPGVQILPHGDIAYVPSPATYAFSRETVTRNLYRIPLP
jgi:hypothetical protein